MDFELKAPLLFEGPKATWRWGFVGNNFFRVEMVDPMPGWFRRLMLRWLLGIEVKVIKDD